MSDLVVRDTPFSLRVDGDERLARAELRRQIGRLEHQLSRLFAEGFPRVEIDTRVTAVAAGPRTLGLGDLERVRDELADRVAEARGALEGRAAGLGHAVGELVADPLEVTQAQGPGCGSGHAHAGVDLDPREALGEKPGELMLEAPDLAAQLGSRKSLVAIDAERKGCVSDEQIRHNPKPQFNSPPGRADHAAVKNLG